LHNRKEPIEFQGHGSKIKITKLDFSTLYHVDRLLTDADVIAINIAAKSHGGYREHI